MFLIFGARFWRFFASMSNIFNLIHIINILIFRYVSGFFPWYLDEMRVYKKLFTFYSMNAINE